MTMMIAISVKIIPTKELPEHAVVESTLILSREKILELVISSLAKKPLLLNGELLKAEKLDLERNSLVPRSLQDPKQAIAIKRSRNLRSNQGRNERDSIQ